MRKFLLALLALLAGSQAAPAALITINFDTDAAGNLIAAPDEFPNATPLTTLYSSLGVTFAGPATGQGGVIFDQSTNVGVNARSGLNFLAFNRDPDVGYANDPETLTFSTPVNSVSIFASGGASSTSFQLQAFNAANTLLGTSTVTAPNGLYSQLSVSATGITRVVLRETGGDGTFVFDDLTFDTAAVIDPPPTSPVPEPVTLAVFGALAAAGLGYSRRKLKGAAVA